MKQLLTTIEWQAYWTVVTKNKALSTGAQYNSFNFTRNCY